MSNEKVIGLDQIKTIKEYIDTKDQISNMTIENNRLKLWSWRDGTSKTYEIELPVEHFLEENSTCFYPKFDKKTAAGYPNVPSEYIDKPVLVLAFRTAKYDVYSENSEPSGSSSEVFYQFIPLDSLIDVYEGSRSSSVNVEVGKDSNGIGNIWAEVCVAPDSDNKSKPKNILQNTGEGLYVPALDDKMDEIYINTNDSDTSRAISITSTFNSDTNGYAGGISGVGRKTEVFDVKLNISTFSDNMLRVENDGLFVAPTPLPEFATEKEVYDMLYS